MKLLLIGIDCATEDSKVGLALAEYHGGDVTLRDATMCSRTRSVATTVAGWLRASESPALLAIDAPLGWPASMGRALDNHRAGHRIRVPPNELFRRTTDRFIHEHLGKTPLDVGADRIARTAHSALSMLAEVSDLLRRPIPLAWSPEIAGVSAIEVYPAATLVARGWRSTGYKKRAQVAERHEIVVTISASVGIGEHGATLKAFPDALDATVCVLAGKDFLEDACPCPADRSLAEREGWIWASTRARL